MAHGGISDAFATMMDLPRLSAAGFAEDDDLLADLSFGEDFCTRIQGVLKDYSPEYSSNEWVANAADAKASEVSFLLDRATYPHEYVIAPQTQAEDLYNSPALIVHNDATFREQDFVGLISAGKGGKADNHETIGRFGLGALSFYHFTEVMLSLPLGEVLYYIHQPTLCASL